MARTVATSRCGSLEMHYETDAYPPEFTYKLLTATITPRPIAWITTQSANGARNAAPYSFFNMMGDNPPIVAVGMMRDPVKGFKDTCSNILATGEFVVNLVPAALAAQMNATCVNAPAGVDELDLAGLETQPSVRIAPPRIMGAPVNLECTLHSAIVTGPHQTLAIGRVEVIHIADEMLLDAERGHVDNASLDLIARLHGAGLYQKGGERFEMARPVWSDT